LNVDSPAAPAAGQSQPLRLKYQNGITTLMSISPMAKG
jgi:hypothetical protein